MHMSNDIFSKLKNYNLPNFGWKKVKKISSDKRDIVTSFTNNATAKNAVLIKWGGLTAVVSEDVSTVLCAASAADSTSNLIGLEEEKDTRKAKAVTKSSAIKVDRLPLVKLSDQFKAFPQTKEAILKAVQMPMPTVYPVADDSDFLDDKDKESYRKLFLDHPWKVSDRFEKGYYGTFMGVSFTFLLSMIDKSKYMYKIGSWNCPISQNSKDLKVVMNHAFEEAWRDYF